LQWAQRSKRSNKKSRKVSARFAAARSPAHTRVLTGVDELKVAVTLLLGTKKEVAYFRMIDAAISTVFNLANHSSDESWSNTKLKDDIFVQYRDQPSPEGIDVFQQ
jgi:hypothetical protein